jgi:hypothetical protein
MGTLIEQFELKQTGRFRGVVDADGVPNYWRYWDNALASGSAGEPLGEGNLASTAEHQHGIQGSGLT